MGSRVKKWVTRLISSSADGLPVLSIEHLHVAHSSEFLQVVYGGPPESMPSVAKRSPKPHLNHVDAQLSTILEADIDMTGEAADSGIDTDAAALAAAAAVAAAGEAETSNMAEARLPLPEDVQSAEAFQVGVH